MQSGWRCALCHRQIVLMVVGGATPSEVAVLVVALLGSPSQVAAFVAGGAGGHLATPLEVLACVVLLLAWFFCGVLGFQAACWVEVPHV